MTERNSLTRALKNARMELHRIWTSEPLNHSKIEVLVAEVRELERRLGVRPWTYPTD